MEVLQTFPFIVHTSFAVLSNKVFRKDTKSFLGVCPSFSTAWRCMIGIMRECDVNTGRASTVSGSTSCSECDAGRFATGAASECTACPEGVAAPLPGLAACEACPLGSTVGLGGATCLCAAGSYATIEARRQSSQAFTCLPCPQGAMCDIPGLRASSLLSRCLTVTAPRRPHEGDAAHRRGMVAE